MTHTDVRVVLTTAPDEDVAARLARALVSGGHAACVNRVPGVRSTYVWEGEVQEDGEVLLWIKTTAQRVPALTALVEQEHPYDCPAVVALPVTDGSQTYLEWVRGACRGSGDAPSA